MKNEYVSKLSKNNDTMSQPLDLTLKSQSQVDELQAQAKEDKDQVAAYNKQIESLMKQDEELEQEKVAIENSKLAYLEENIFQEYNIVLQYVDASYALKK